MKPRRTQRLNRICAGRRLRENDMILINASKPIDQTDEIGEKQIQRRYEQRFFGKFRMQSDRDHFRNHRRDAQ